MRRYHKIFSFCLLALLVSLSGNLFAGGENQAAGARRVGLGFAYTGVRGDFWTLFHNPAGIAGIKQMEVGAFVERRFLLNQLNSGTIGFVMPFNGDRHFAGFDVSSFGFGGYSDSKIGLTYAALLLEKLSLGAKVNYVRTSIPDYGTKSSVFVDFGLLASITENISAGFRVYNASQSYISKPLEEKIPTTLDVGIAYQASDKVLVVADVQKQVNFSASFRGGIEYAILDILKARIGASTNPTTLNAGLGLVLKNGLNIDFANTLHQHLGYTPSFSLSWRFRSKSESK